MKPIGEQFKEAFAWKNRLYSPRDFILTTIAGFAILYGFIFWTSGNSVHSGFDIKIAIGGFALVGVCVLLASNRVSVLSCAVMMPAASCGSMLSLPAITKSFCFALPISRSDF
jgi:hypothetical protein